VLSVVCGKREMLMSSACLLSVQKKGGERMSKRANE
jgi:hypothetical protein